HVVSTPSRMSSVAGSPASVRNDSIGDAGGGGASPIPKPCVLCIARLRAAIDANVSPSTGSTPVMSSFTTPAVAGTAVAPAPPIPDPERFPVVFREPEVLRAREILPAAVEAPGREQLLRPRDAEKLPQLRTEQVLSPVTTRQREVRGPVPPTARKVRDDARV